MKLVALSAAAMLVALSTSGAEARARFKFRSSSPSPVATAAPKPTAPVQAGTSGSVVLPGALLGASIGSRAARARDTREDLPTASMSPVSAMPSSAAARPATPAPVAKPVFVCGADRTVGRGLGFCDLN